MNETQQLIYDEEFFLLNFISCFANEISCNDYKKNNMNIQKNSDDSKIITLIIFHNNKKIIIKNEFKNWAVSQKDKCKQVTWCIINSEQLTKKIKCKWDSV